MTQPPLGGISGTAKAISHVRVTLVSSGQVGLHLKYAAQLRLHGLGVAAMRRVDPHVTTEPSSLTAAKAPPFPTTRSTLPLS